MNIEEGIEILKNSKKLYLKEKIDSDILEEAIETLITAYEEKGEECDFLDKELYNANQEIQKLQINIQKEKEKNKELENDLKDMTKRYMEAESVKFWYNYIHKDKIRKMLQELEDRRNKQPVIGYWSKKAMLEKLLKEE